jgi:hypothetical protein
MCVGVQGDVLATLLPGKRPHTRCLWGGWAPGPVWTGAENFAPTGIRFPDRPAFRESLYRLRHRGPQMRQHYEFCSRIVITGISLCSGR